METIGILIDKSHENGVLEERSRIMSELLDSNLDFSRNNSLWRIIDPTSREWRIKE